MVDHRAPLLGEPLPLELANTTYVRRGRIQDGLRTPAHLADWLRGVRARLEIPLADEDLASVDDVQLMLSRDLRACIYELAEATLNRKTPQDPTLDRLNRVIAMGPRWTELRWGDDPYTEACSDAPPVIAALSEIAESTVRLFSGPRRPDIHRCGAPDCILLFLKDHPRRAWCSTACGNRVRAARHYERTRKQPH